MSMSEDVWKDKLTPEQYRVLREKGTEAPFSGKFLHHDEAGMYTCAACGAELFKSDSKYESDIPGLAGWPSFGDVIDGGAVELRDDNSLGMNRTEVVCKNCGSHLGHIFDDESSPTGKHYCINSVCLDFKKQ
ncbi:peptide-methionine (R)-S-oxide reductase MsrB [soil metagenome]